MVHKNDSVAMRPAGRGRLLRPMDPTGSSPMQNRAEKNPACSVVRLNPERMQRNRRSDVQYRRRFLGARGISDADDVFFTRKFACFQKFFSFFKKDISSTVKIGYNKIYVCEPGKVWPICRIKIRLSPTERIGFTIWIPEFSNLWMPCRASA